MSMPDHESNRSAAMTPEQLAQMNQMVSAAVQEAVGAALAGAFKGLGPILEQIALTPEKMQQLKAPYQDPKKKAREDRELKNWKLAETEARQVTEQRKANCQHLDKRGQTSIRLIRNYPDRQPRGICVLCHDLIYPRHWEIGPPDDENPRGKAYLTAAHKNYQTVLQILSTE